MARGLWRKNGSDDFSTYDARGFWGKLSGGTSWLPVKEAWAVRNGAWQKFWPPDQTFTSFTVWVSSGEVGYTVSDVSWELITDVPGTVTIQRKAPGGAWTDWITGQAKADYLSKQLLAPTRAAAGTWTYRALFIPTNEPTYITYSPEDTVSLTVPSIIFALTQQLARCTTPTATSRGPQRRTSLGLSPFSGS